MNNFILFDDNRKSLLPLTYTRPVAGMRVGILTIAEKWEKLLNQSVSFLTENYLSDVFQKKIDQDNVFINGSILPDAKLITAINSIKKGFFLVKENIIIAAHLGYDEARQFSNNIGNAEKIVNYPEELVQLKNTWQIFSINETELKKDFELLTKGRKSASISSTNHVASPENIFIEEGAKVEFCTLNASTGPIYIGKAAEIMEGCLVRGPLALGDKACLKMGAKIYGATTIGPNCKVGGEVHNTVMFANSNKAHDGFLGNAVIGEWCNLGADTNNSNLKNNYSEVKLWDYSRERFVPTGLQFCGLIMGDHSKCGINTMFNTGTVVGVSANIFGSGYPRNFIPSFTWGGPQGISVYPLQKAVETAEIVLKRRNITLTENDKKIFENIFIESEKYRRLS